MKKNNKGFTLIESIVAVFIMSIMIVTFGYGISRIYLQMANSEILKNASNTLFSDIQSDSTSSGVTSNSYVSTITIGSYTIDGKITTVSKDLNSIESLELTKFDADSNIDDNNNSKETSTVTINLKLVTNYAQRENSWAQANAGSYNASIIKDSFLDSAKIASDLDVDDSLDIANSFSEINIDKNNSNFVSAFNHVNSDGYSISDCSVVYYRYIKESSSEYTLYGFVKPSDKILCCFKQGDWYQMVSIDKDEGLPSNWSWLCSNGYKNDLLNNGQTLTYSNNSTFLKDANADRIYVFHT